jgi:hypothetical protein
MEERIVIPENREEMLHNATEAGTNEDRHVRVQLIQYVLAHYRLSRTES